MINILTSSVFKALVEFRWKSVWQALCNWWSTIPKMVIANIIDNNNNSTHKSSSFPWDLHFNWKTPYLGNVKKKMMTTLGLVWPAILLWNVCSGLQTWFLKPQDKVQWFQMLLIMSCTFNSSFSSLCTQQNKFLFHNFIISMCFRIRL